MNSCNCGKSFDSKKGLSVHKSWCEDKRGSMKKEYTCKECGGTFENYESRDTGGKHQFCSKECKDTSETNGQIVKCSWCSENTYKPKSSLNEMGDYSIDNHFCDKSCESSWKREHWTGEDHPSWRGGSPSHRGSNWLEQRRLALERDGYSCKVCGCSRAEHYDEYGFDLGVHHKIPARTFYVIEDANYQTNLVTVCRGCHAKLDKISRREANRKPTISAK